MKKLYRSLAFSLIAASGLFLTSCNDDESLAREGKPTVTLTNNAITAYEGFGSYLEFDFSYEIKEEAQVRIEVVGGTATEGDDYYFNINTVAVEGFDYFGGEGYLARLDAYSNKYVLVNYIRLIEDGIVDPNETIELKITSVSKGTILIEEFVTITINEQSSLDASTLDVQLDFTGDITVDGATSSKCDIDMDLYISADADGNTDEIHSWYDCPENVQVDNDVNTWGATNEGLLYVVTDLWSRGGSLPAINGITNHEDITMDLNFTKTVNGNQEFVESFTISRAYDTSMTASENGGAGEVHIAKIFLTGDKYIILNTERTSSNNNLVALARTSSSSHPRKNAVK